MERRVEWNQRIPQRRVERHGQRRRRGHRKHRRTGRQNLGHRHRSALRAGNWLHDAGRNIVQGLINGIGGAFGWLRRTITSLGRNVVGWAKSVLGIHSPSRVFRDEIGQYIPQGMALGIKDATSYAANAMDGLNDAITARTPDITFGTGASATPSLASTSAGEWSSATPSDTKAGQPSLTRQDLLDCLRVVMSDGVTLHLNSRGVEVMAGKLAKPMAYELEKASALGR